MFLVMWKGVNPEWVLSGFEPCFLTRVCEVRYETGEEWQARNSNEKLSPKLLTRPWLTNFSGVWLIESVYRGYQQTLLSRPHA